MLGVHVVPSWGRAIPRNCYRCVSISACLRIVNTAALGAIFWGREQLRNRAGGSVRYIFTSGVMRSGSDSSFVIPLLPWRLRNCAMMTALCRMVLDPKPMIFLEGHDE